MNKKLIAALSAALLSLGAALPTLAQTGVEATSQGVVNVGSTRVGADADVNVKVDTSIKTSGSASGTGGVRVQAGDVNGDGVGGIAATGTVHGDPDFDLAISTTESTEDRVAVSSNQSAKLFGFIPVTVEATAVVEADGRVKVKFPWYAFLMVTNKADLQAKIQNRVNAAIGANVNANATAQATAKLSAAAQAQVIAAVKAALQAEFNAAANVNASANTSTR